METFYFVRSDGPSRCLLDYMAELKTPPKGWGGSTTTGRRNLTMMSAVRALALAARASSYYSPPHQPKKSSGVFSAEMQIQQL